MICGADAGGRTDAEGSSREIRRRTRKGAVARGDGRRILVKHVAKGDTTAAADRWTGDGRRRGLPDGSRGGRQRTGGHR